MLFNSFEFALYFPVVLALYFALPHRRRWLLLLVASYVFYMAWEPAYALLILASTTVDYWIGRALGRLEDGRRRKALVALSLVVNLGLLFSFKYYNLVNGTFAWLVALVGWHWPLPESNLLLPVGISFYTFQTIGYVIDVYRRKISPELHFGIFALYVSFFPQLVAGPIERAGRLLPQFRRIHVLDWNRMASGLRLVAWGMFKKVVVADRLAPICDVVYADPGSFSGFAIVIGTLCFGFQVYCDFSGYSDIAIGIARVMGYDLMKNFDQPHLASSVSEYWARWHISLTTWFRDYLYLPLGGNRVSVVRWWVNVLIVFTVSGIWHGAEWSLAVWGALNGLYLLVGRTTQSFRTRVAQRVGLTLFPRLYHASRVVVTFVLIYFGYTFFRAENMSEWVVVMTRLGTAWEGFGDLARLEFFLARIDMGPALFLFCMLLMPLTELIEFARRYAPVRDRLANAPTSIRWAGDYALVFATLLFGNFNEHAFFYFQF